ncbi:MAG: fbpC [Devosia sp.]|uniref:ABC transporter ATP-binding protein n=1 Tax=Devosia sp. TaxID=1871048 RepID=UPI0026377876|nr:ABC transporter ATP-binding protein [Devosia sp.]MDB5541330.1 fbpC [Devosia sp.]
MTILTLHGLGKRYGSVVALDNIDLEVPAGSRTAIVGPSGCGKTTLLRLIAGFEMPDAGCISLGGTVLLDGKTAVPAHKRRIGYVSQEGALFPHLTIADNIGFGLARRDPERHKRIAELMARVELPVEMMNRRPHELSGGQQQRAALARALALRPRLMLLDEPFSALDAGLREAMRDMVGELLSAAGITTILVTHDQAEALSFAEHLVVMRDGAVVQSGTPQQLYLQPRDAVTARFLGEAIILDAVIVDGRAQFAFGDIAADASAPADKVRVMLRPEQVRMTAASADTANARVLSRAFRGPTCRLVVQSLSASANTITLVVSSLDSPEVGELLRLAVIGPVHVL